MSVCNPVQRSELLTNYVNMPDEFIAKLRPLIVGADYAVRTYVDSTGYNYLGAYDGSTGVTAAWPNLETGETVELPSSTSFTTAYVNDALVILFLGVSFGPPQGAKYGTSSNKVTYASETNVWNGTNFNIPYEAAIGDYVLLDDGSATLETTIIGFEKSSPTGDYNVLVLKDNTSALASTFNITIAEIVPELIVDATDTVATSTTIEIPGSLSAQTERITASSPVIGGNTNDGDVLSRAYVSYRALRPTTLSTRVQSVRSEEEMADYFVGYTNPASGLGFAVLRALPPVLDPVLENPPDVKFLSVGSDDTAGWATAIGLFKRRSDWAYLAPLTNNETQLATLKNVITYRSTHRLPSEMFICRNVKETDVLFTGVSGDLVSITQTESPTLNRTVTRIAGSASPFTDASVGDTVILNNGATDVTFIIAEVISAQTVVSTTDIPVTSYYIVSVTHTLSSEEQTDELGEYVLSIANQYINVVFPTKPTWNDVEVNGYFLAAALAGARGYTPPHQGLRALQLETGWLADQTYFDFADDIDTLDTYGMMIIDSTEDGINAYIFSANTSDPSSIKTAREVHVSNILSVDRFIYEALACYEGRSKISLNIFNKIRTTAVDALNIIKASTNISNIGRAVASWIVSQPYVNPNQNDEVIVPISYTIYMNINTLTIQLSASVTTTV